MKKKEKIPFDEMYKLSKEFHESIQNLTNELMKRMIPAIKEATENIKKLGNGKEIIDSLELIQDEEEDEKI